MSSRGLLGQGALAGAGPGSRGGARRVVLGARDGVHAEEAEHHLALLIPPAQFIGGAFVSRPRSFDVSTALVTQPCADRQERQA